MKILLVPQSGRPVEQAAYLLSILEVLGRRTERNVPLQGRLAEILAELSDHHFSEAEAAEILRRSRPRIARLVQPAT